MKNVFLFAPAAVLITALLVAVLRIRETGVRFGALVLVAMGIYLLACLTAFVTGDPNWALVGFVVAAAIAATSPWLAIHLGLTKPTSPSPPE